MTTWTPALIADVMQPAGGSSMSENKQRAEQQFVERRSRSAGIKSGGRRKSDRRWLYSGKKSRIWIAISFGVSAFILAWAFTLPFRGNAGVSFDGPEAKSADVNANPVGYSSDGMANDQYVQQMMALDLDLQRKILEKQRKPKDLPDHQQARSHWKQGLRQRVEDVKLLVKMADGEIQKGAIEWQSQKDLRDYLEDAPE